MATPHNIVYLRINPVHEFFANAIDDDEIITHEIKLEELESVDQVIWKAQADLREHLVSTYCNNPRFGAFKLSP